MARDDFSRLRGQLMEVAGDPEFQAAVREELGTRSLEVLQERVGRLQDDHMYVAILGRQGVGKSSLINALLFSREVLPVDIDETTNVLCKVVHDQGQGAAARVLLANGDEERGPASRDFLAKFVDEQQNPDNRERVREVIVQYPSSFLEDGIAFVDTPGVGSLTSRNHRVTMDFLPKVSCAVFLFSTTPTLLKSEVEFLRATWPFSQNFFFVQNVWGENGDDIRDAESDNLDKIRQLAREFGTEPTSLRVFTVDVHRGLHGARNNDPEAYRSSGMADLASAVRAFVNTGAGRLRLIDGLRAMGAAVAAVRRSVDVRLEELLARDRENEVDFLKRVNDARDSMRQVEARWSSDMTDFDHDMQQAGRAFDLEADRELAEAKRSLQDLVDQGRTDAERVGRAIEQQLGLAAKKAVAAYERAFKAALRKLEQAYSVARGEAGKVAYSFDPRRAKEAVGLNPVVEAIGGFFKWGGEVAVGLIGLEGLTVFGATLLAGEGIAAAVTAAATAIPGAGLIVAGAILVGGWLVKKHFEGESRSRLRGVIDSAVEEVRRRLKEDTHRQFDEAGGEAKRLMDADLQRELAEERRLMSAIIQARNLGKEEAERLAGQLKARRAVADRIAALIEAIAQEVAANDRA
jgi:GTPase SAR1 family protein